MVQAQTRRPGRLRRGLSIFYKALLRFVAHDGWAIASHIALSVLMSLFPFLIVVTALAGFTGAVNLAEEVATIILDAWPVEVGGPIAREVTQVLTVRRTDALTIGALFALYFASSGVEALRTGLNRAYEAIEWRPWWMLRLEAIFYVIGGAVVLLAFALLVVLGPLAWTTALRWVPGLAPFSLLIGIARLAATTLLIICALLIAHKFLPAGYRRFRRIAPGIVFTLVFWLASGLAFGLYLESFAGAYVTTYAGLATAMIALVFLYTLAAIFLLGGEINAVLAGRDAPANMDEASR